MAGSVSFLGAVTLGVLLGSSCVANAQTVQNAQPLIIPCDIPPPLIRSSFTRGRRT